MYESLTQNTVNGGAPDDLGSMVWHFAGLVPWKSIIFVFLMYMIMNTTVFVDSILGSWPGAVDQRYPSERGLIIQACMMALGLIIFSILVNGGVL